MSILIPKMPHVGGGCMITFVGDNPDQAVYWELVSIDPATGFEGAPLGTLKWDKTKTDGAGLSVNPYFAPQTVEEGWHDRVKVRWGNA